MSDEEKLEIRGRLWLWSSALDECANMLKTAQRAEIEMSSQDAIAKEERYVIALNEFSRDQPDYESGVSKLAHLSEFQKIQSKEFPSFTDCSCIKDYCRMLAIVFFCQIFKQGKPVSGVVANNNGPFREIHLKKLRDDLFQTEHNKKVFDEFCDQCESARDKMIGHADGYAFDIKHGTSISTMNNFRVAIKEINFMYMTDIVSLLSKAILAYEIK
jgi:hypothetical protein